MTVINLPQLGAAEGVTAAQLAASYPTPIIDARKFVGKTPTGATDVRSKLQEAFDVAAAVGAEKETGCYVQLPPWISQVGGVLEIDSLVAILGLGKASLIKLGAGSNSAVLRTKRYNEGGANGGAENVGLYHVHIDANFAQNGTTPAGTSALGLDGIRMVGFDIEVRNGVVNMEQFQSRNVSPGTEKLEDSDFDVVGLKDPQELNGNFRGHDSKFNRVSARSNVAGFANLRTSNSVVLTTCHPYGNAKYAYQLAGASTLNSCIGEGGREGQVSIEADGCDIRGGKFFAGGGADGKIGMLVGSATKTAFSTHIEGARVEGCINGAYIMGEAGTSGSRITGWVSGAEGFAVKGSASNARYFDLKVVGGMQLAEAGTITLAEFASANEWEIPNTYRVFNRIALKVTGVVELKKCKNVPPGGTELTLIFTSTAKMVDGENQHMAGNFEGGADRSISFLSDGVNLIESGRSTN